MPIIDRGNFSRAHSAAYLRHTAQTLRSRSAGSFGRIWDFSLAFPGLVQGLYFVLTGVWPLAHIESFMAVTGPKTDLWLVQTVGVLVLVIGLVLCLAGYRRQRTPEVLLLALGSALALAGVDCVFVIQGRISAIYLLDAAVELVLVALWVYPWLGDGRPVPLGPPLEQAPPAGVVQNGRPR